jgi:hypothetical protein
MRFLLFIVLALLAIFAGAEENCDDIICTYQYEPVCAQADGTLPITLGNECAVRQYSCTEKKREIQNKLVNMALTRVIFLFSRIPTNIHWRMR